MTCKVCHQDCQGRWFTVDGEPLRCGSCLLGAYMGSRRRVRELEAKMGRIAEKVLDAASNSDPRLCAGWRDPHDAGR